MNNFIPNKANNILTVGAIGDIGKSIASCHDH